MKPTQLALTADGATLLVAGAAGTGGVVRMLSAATGRAIGADLELESAPTAFCLAPSGARAYAGLAPQRGKGGLLKRIFLGRGRPQDDGDARLPFVPAYAVFSADGTFVYAGGEEAGRLVAVDTKWNAEDSTVAGVPSAVCGAALAPPGRWLFLAAREGRLVQVDLAANAVARSLDVSTCEMAVSPDGARLYAGAGEADVEIKVVSAARAEVERTVNVGWLPGALAAHPGGRWLWAAFPRNGQIGLVDVEARTLAATVEVGRLPSRLATAPDGRTVYALLAGDRAIAVVSLAAPAAAEREPEPAPEPTVRAAASSATRWALAVGDLEPQGVSGSAAAIVTDWLRDELVRTGAYQVTERRQMQAILAEQALQQTGCTDQDCAVRIGKLLNVQRMLVGSLGKFEEHYVVTVRLVNVESGEVTWSGTARGRSIDEVEAAVRRVARGMAAEGG